MERLMKGIQNKVQQQATALLHDAKRLGRVHALGFLCAAVKTARAEGYGRVEFGRLVDFAWDCCGGDAQKMEH